MTTDWKHLAGAGLAATAAAFPAKAASWTDLAWDHRPIVVSAPSASSPDMKRQRAAWAGRSQALLERDIVLIEIIGSETKTIVGPEIDESAAVLRNRLGLSPDMFGIVLVGKDTGIKLRSDEPVSAGRIFSLIDSMPMRRREIRQRDD